MKNFSNKYIFIYSIILVAVVAVLLSVVAVSLKDKQQTNVRNEKMQTLLAAINVDVERDAAEAAYKEYFKEELTVRTDGTIASQYDVATVDISQADRAFNINLKAEQTAEKAEANTGRFPIYVFEKDGRKGYVIPTQGNGLWGAIYSNIALDEDFNTVVGVTFSHESETPGLGAEITTKKFQDPFLQKQILDEDGTVVSIAVKKNADKDGIHEVDAISGGTMTSNGVNAMLKTDLARYQNFITAQLGAAEKESVEAESIEESEPINEEEE